MTALNQNDLSIRLGEQTDLPFVVDSWAKSLKHTYPNSYILDAYPKFRAQAEALLPKAVLALQVLDDSPDDIVSWLAYTSFQQQLVVLYAYTRKDDRRQGFLNQLLAFANPEGHRVIFTFPCINENIMDHFGSKYIYDPYLLGLI
jgi:hypothetical protein